MKVLEAIAYLRVATQGNKTVHLLNICKSSLVKLYHLGACLGGNLVLYYFYRCRIRKEATMRKVWTTQERNETIVQWAMDNKVVLLEESKSFVSNKAPIYYKWQSTELKGLIGKTKFDNIVVGNKPTVNGLTEESKQLRAKQRFAEYGLELLEPYKDFNTKHSVKITKGTYNGFHGKTSLSAVNQKRTRGKKEEVTFSILTDSEKERHFTEFAERRGYKILEFPKKLTVRGKCKLLSPQGHEWETVWYHFAYQGNCNCPQDVKRSIGERMVSSILTANAITFEEQRKLVIDGRTLFLDFYLPDYNLAIEYNGRQHYEAGSGFLEGALKTIQERDQAKRAWCQQNEVTLVEISYLVNSVREVAGLLAKYVPITEFDVNISYANGLVSQEVIDYYKTHLGSETAEHFGITKRQLGLLCQRAGFNKREANKRIDKG